MKLPAIFSRQHLDYDGSFTPRSIVILMSSDPPQGRYWFVILRLPFVRWRRTVQTLNKFQLATERRWCYPIWMWFKEPNKHWRRQSVEWGW